MGFGDTAKKIQTLADRAERTYQKINELREEVEQTQTTVVDTAERVHTLENEMAEQRAVLDAVAREVGVDLDSVRTEAHIVDAEADTTDDGEAETDRVEEGGDAEEDGDAEEGDNTSDNTGDEPAA
ncbi:hypothetical protein C461_06014 [Halorubrum aidingense JCM 13560]|uniref:Uncharacterized protein n=1 Tax=Halorubrum aidingense JCM 13560 TaxID=1230454 RepID=M0PDU9_9EURY|nr:DUF5798 family protein [Halorubrum aidingense]EMA68317.1 hypothetical protein C461_06014 [Halorubrum aidingense JCM 13560]